MRPTNLVRPGSNIALSLCQRWTQYWISSTLVRLNLSRYLTLARHWIQMLSCSSLNVELNWLIEFNTMLARHFEPGLSEYTNREITATDCVPTRHCKEFKIVIVKITWWHKMSPFGNKIKKLYSPCLVSVVHLAYFIIWKVLRCLLQLALDKVKA